MRIGLFQYPSNQIETNLKNVFRIEPNRISNITYLCPKRVKCVLLLLSWLVALKGFDSKFKNLVSFWTKGASLIRRFKDGPRRGHSEELAGLRQPWAMGHGAWGWAARRPGPRAARCQTVLCCCQFSASLQTDGSAEGPGQRRARHGRAGRRAGIAWHGEVRRGRAGQGAG